MGRKAWERPVKRGVHTGSRAPLNTPPRLSEGDLLYEDASRLTRGQAQLTCIARALAQRPGLLLLDEPTRLLDAMTGMKVEALIHALRKECTMVVAVHSPQMAGRIAEESAMMEDGRVLEWGRTSDLFYHPKHLHTEQFVSSRFL